MIPVIFNYVIHLGMGLGERGIFGERLVTTASEWSSRVDIDSIKIQRSNL